MILALHLAFTFDVFVWPLISANGFSSYFPTFDINDNVFYRRRSRLPFGVKD